MHASMQSLHSIYIYICTQTLKLTHILVNNNLSCKRSHKARLLFCVDHQQSGQGAFAACGTVFGVELLYRLETLPYRI